MVYCVVEGGGLNQYIYVNTFSSHMHPMSAKSPTHPYTPKQQQ